MKIYTRTGDDGYTFCMAKKGRVKKYSNVMMFMGALDESNSYLGFSRSICSSEVNIGDLKDILEFLEYAQKLLFNIGFEISGSQRFKGDEDAVLEAYIDKFMEGINLKGFIIPYGTPCVSSIHVARSIVRRAEREFFRALDTDLTERREELLFLGKLLNRLSDALFAAALRAAIKTTGIEYV
ncbi:MAG: ATP:cob(I)alamin adenosyltransferase [Desulfurococcales archaeon]|nr:ATP:cob(I)alamin adenosyltransferase [Desulfurococcales archaeon]